MTMAYPNNDASDSDREWDVHDDMKEGGSRYPVHDACEFEDAEALRRLIFVPRSDETNVSSDSSTSTDSSSSTPKHFQHHGVAMSGDAADPPSVVMENAQATLSSQRSVDDVCPIEVEGAKINGEGAPKVEGGPEQVTLQNLPQQDNNGNGNGNSNDIPTRDEGKAGAASSALGARDETQIMGNKFDECDKDKDMMTIDGADSLTHGQIFDECEKETMAMGTADSLTLTDPQVCEKQVGLETPADKTEDGDGKQFGTMNNMTVAHDDSLDIDKSNIEQKGRVEIKFFCPHDLDERDDDGNTPLHIAIHARKIENVRILLEAGATAHKKCDGSAPIHLAISLGAVAAHAQFAKICVDLLRQYGADLTTRDDSFHTPLYLACASNLRPVVEMLLGDPLSRETLDFRADRTGGRALHAAAKWDNAHVRRGATRGGGGICVTEMLLSVDKMEIDARDNYGRTPLHVAALYGNWHVARLLINAGANAGSLDKRGSSPGQWARKRGMVVPNDLKKVLGEDGDHVSPTRDLIMDPDGKTLILCHELCIQHRTCPPIVRGDAETSEPPPENVRRLNVLINDDDGILRCGEFDGCKWHTDVRRAALSDVLKVHEYAYIERTSKLCSATPDHPRAIQTLDADTTVSHWSFEAALRAAGSVCEAVDKIMAGDVRNAFCAIRPPGHHAGPRGIVTCPNDPDGSHGFCLLNNIAIGAAYARSMYRNDGIKKIAIIDFDVHHGNGTEEIVRHLAPNVEHAMIRTPFAVGSLHSSTYKPWLDENDINEVFFASTHGYGPRDRQLQPGAVQGGWFYPASGKTSKSKSLSSPPDVETPNLAEFLMSQTWSRLGDDYRNNCCKIIDIGLGLPARDDTYNHGLQRVELRDAYRKTVIPSLLEFDPDIIFISAGFDAHRRDTMNFGYVGMVEEDYEWLTEQLVKVANTCCKGRVVSALEGGYKIHGGIVSPFARSVASHVRALVDGGNSREEYDMKEGEWESRFERHMNEEKERKRQMKSDRHTRVAEDPLSHISPNNNMRNAQQAPGSREDELTLGDLSQNDEGDNDEPSSKRTRKQVDYKHLFEQLKKEGF